MVLSLIGFFLMVMDSTETASCLAVCLLFLIVPMWYSVMRALWVYKEDKTPVNKVAPNTGGLGELLATIKADPARGASHWALPEMLQIAQAEEFDLGTMRQSYARGGWPAVEALLMPISDKSGVRSKIINGMIEFPGIVA